jgi:regulator of sigma E protease
MEVLIIAAQLILSLSILVVLHEFGHYIPAKLFKIKVEKFYLFFDPWFSLFKRKIGETEWGIGWLPLGGYVKISGMVDESMDKDQLAQPAKPWEFRSKPAWQRLIVMIGGVTVNFLLALFIYSMILFVWGKQYLTTESAEKFGMAVAYPELKQFGLEDGDIPLMVGNKKVDNINKVFSSIVIEGERQITVKRNGENHTIQLPKNFDQIALKNGYTDLYVLRMPTVVSNIPDGSKALEAGLKVNDSIIGINQQPTPYFNDLQTALMNNKNKTVEVEVVRNNETHVLNAAVDSNGHIGFQPMGYNYYNIPYATETYSFFEAFPAGAALGIETLSNYVKSMGLVFSKEGVKQVGGFGSMSKIFAPVWDWKVFWSATALLSVILAFMNILPIPALDGGHVVFLLYEIITGKEAPQKVLEYAQYVGFILLITLMVYANGNDIYKFFFK